jgi:arsenite-transporting ATPase
MSTFVCYGGKGGVGKTTLAASTALAAADQGAKTLVISTDPAHSLADAFGVESTVGQQTVDDNLWIEELSPDAGRAAYRALVDSLANELRAAGIQLDDETVERLFTAGVIPGSDELAAIEALAAHVGGTEFDRIIVDTAPTGHTLRLLELPSVLRETVAAAESLQGQLRRAVDTARTAVFGPAYLFGRQRKGPDEFEAMAGRMKQVRDLLTDPERVDFRVVCLPESMAVAETTRLVAQLSEMGVPVETVVVNRVLTDADPDCQRCRATQQAHQDQISQLEAAVPDREIVTLPAIRDDMTARETVNQIAHRLPNELVEQTA